MTSRDSDPCAFCGAPVRHPPPGWNGTDPLYCTEHTALRGRDPQFVIPAALKAAEDDMMKPADTLVDWCLPELTETFGFLLPGTVTYGAAFPKNGKTAFLSNNLAYWDRKGVRTWVMPTESRPKGLITRLACFRAGVSPDEVLSRRLRKRMDEGDKHAERQFLDVLHVFHDMMEGCRDDGSNIAIEPAPRLTHAVFKQSVKAAKEGGYELVVVDHVDHIAGDATVSGYQASENVQYDALAFAEEHDIAVLLMTQLNTSRTARDPLIRYRRPIPDWLWMKGVKDQIATTMFGIYRPMDPSVDDKVLADVKEGRADSWRVAMPHTMGVADMLSRYNGANPDKSVYLNYDAGIITSKLDNPEHAIWTGGASERPRGWV